ncbi:MAG: histidine kinase, partial [Corynebacterium variabile]|uniref:sensor histidine kinase n=1 Tax=Corynebacterium variabile TaxID=1727 RepID=UPI0026472721
GPTGLRSPVGRDIAAVVLAVLMVTVWFLDPDPLPRYAGTWFTVVSVILGAASVIALRWRRSRATAVAVTLILLSTVFGVTAGPSLIALFTVAGYRPLRTTVTVTGLALATVPVQLVLGSPLRGDAVLPGMVLLCCLVLLSVTWALVLRSRRELVASLQERARHLLRERDHAAEQARRDEREMIADQLHDSLAHHLTLISMSAGSLSYCADDIPDDLASVAGTVQRQSTEALSELRDALRDLRQLRGAQETTDAGFTGDLGRSLELLVREVRDAGQDVALCSRIFPGLNTRLSEVVFRAVRELLTNARRHAPGVPVTLDVTASTEGGVVVTCTNQSTGTSSGDPTGTGLIGISERVRLYGGRLRTITTDGIFTARIEAPWTP